MKKHEFYPDYRDLFEYYGSNEIARIRIKGGRAVRLDWFIFDSTQDARIFFNEKCGSSDAWTA